jgi:hypothetical protein
MYYSKIYSHGSGLTNQIFALITSIIIAICEKESIVVFDHFLDDFSKEDYTIISHIIDLEQMNIYLFDKYGIVLIDRHNIDSRIVSENIMNEINKTVKYNHIVGSVNNINKDLFENILMNIRFHTDFVEKADSFIQKLGSKKTNIIHLRLEDDAITHWSKINDMSEDEFRCLLENKYIELIKQHLDKNDETIILSSSSKNGVIDFLEQEGYSYKFTEKHFAGREKNAIIDLLISKRCNNIFIGNFNPVKLNGSSFSYFILKSLDNDVKKIMIDLDRILDVEIIQ